MSTFQPQNPNYEGAIRAIFGRQRVMSALGVSIIKLAPGEAILEMPYTIQWTQQNDFTHAGIVTTLVDTACGCATISLAPPESDVLTIEYKVNLLSPAVGERFRAHAQVKKAGRTITVCQGDVFAITQTGEKLVTTMLATLMVRPVSDGSA